METALHNSMGSTTYYRAVPTHTRPWAQHCITVQVFQLAAGQWPHALCDTCDYKQQAKAAAWLEVQNRKARRGELRLVVAWEPTFFLRTLERDPTASRTPSVWRAISGETVP